MFRKIEEWGSRPIFREYKTMFWAWMISGLIGAVAKLILGKYNNYKIFEGTFWHALNGQTLYGPYPEYYDFNHYGVVFTAVIAPFAILPQWLGVILWVAANTALLFYAIKRLPFNRTQQAVIFWFSLCELYSAQSVQQFNISIVAFVVLSFTLVQSRKEFWAAFVIILGTYIKVYSIVGLAFFFFSKNKIKFILYGLFWIVVFFLFPMLYTSPEYVVSQYFDWFKAIEIKNQVNTFATSQNISLLGLVRKLSGNPHYSDLWLIIPALILFLIPYFRVQQYRNLNFRLMLLANVLLFVVLFSTGTEASSYISAMIGVAIWYICTPSKRVKWDKIIFIATLVLVGISTTELVPKVIRQEFITPFVTKSWMCIWIWLRVSYEMIFCQFDNLPKFAQSSKRKKGNHLIFSPKEKMQIF